jgi:hypothetical protein
MGTTIGAGWVQPTSIDTRLFADRDRERRQIEDILDDLLRSGTRRQRIAIYGDRGIGKSILTSAALTSFAARHPDRVVRVVVNGRGIAFRQSLKALAGELVKGVKPMVEGLGAKGDVLLRWLDELALLAHNDQISEEQVDEVGSQHGIAAQIGGGLFGLLKGESSMSWQKSRQRSLRAGRVQTVSDDLLHTALTATLQKIHDETDFMIVVFFDDLDQAYTDDIHAMKPALKRILDIDPCVGLVHVRTEMLFDDLRREMDDSIEVGPLEAQGLLAILMRRLSHAPLEDRIAFEKSGIPDAARKLAGATGNPLAFLRWVHAFLRSGEWPPASPTSWQEAPSLLRVVARASTSAGIEDELLCRLSCVADRCLRADGQKILKEDLRRGFREGCCDDGRGISQDELDLFVRTGMLVPRDRFREEAGYRLDPTLDLLRPSVAARLREP